MNESTSRTLGSLLLVVSLLGFAAGTTLPVLGSPVDTPLVVLAALALACVGAGSAMKNRDRSRPT
jgi:hypothetical protein